MLVHLCVWLLAAQPVSSSPVDAAFSRRLTELADLAATGQWKGLRELFSRKDFAALALSVLVQVQG